MKKIIFIVVALLITTYTMGQIVSTELISSSGDVFCNSNYQLDWSIGECITETFNSESFIFAQGFHQGDYIVTEIENLSNIEAIVYPNPTSDLIILRFTKNTEFEKSNYTITDLTGKDLVTYKIQSELEQIDFSNYANGFYLLTITQDNKIIKTFQIIKK